MTERLHQVQDLIAERICTYLGCLGCSILENKHMEVWVKSFTVRKRAVQRWRRDTVPNSNSFWDSQMLLIHNLPLFSTMPGIGVTQLMRLFSASPFSEQ